MAKRKTSTSKVEPATVITVGTILRTKFGDEVVKEIAVVKQQDTGEWKTLLVIDLCWAKKKIPNLAPHQVYLDEVLSCIKRKTFTPIDGPKPRAKKSQAKK